MEVRLIDGDDWEGLYIDGKLVTQGHHVTVDEVMEAMGVNFKRVFADTEWLVERGHLPDKLRQVKKAR